jgi:MarR family transcriptional regulator, organic hydroperoxide resistance regulator
MRDEAPAVYRLIGIAKQLGVFVGERLAPLGLHTGQERLLAALWEEDGLSQTQLVAQLSVRPPTVTEALKRLEREGFVTRAPDQANRRISRVYLTDRGRGAEAPVREIFREAERTFLAELSAPERRELAGLLERIGPD